jgi:ATP-dependent RNA helicase RhlE
VLDEADRMLDMGFIPDIKRIMALLPRQRQNLLFSATFSNDIRKLADELLNKPRLIEVTRRNTAAETVSQSAYKVPQEAKRGLLEHLVTSRNVWQVLCFVRTKHGASRLARQLERDGLATSAIHGDKTQAARLEALAKFKQGKLQVLVATDVAARGLDIDDLPLVVNYELPHVPEDYIHRIGRTGRAGASGEAISFVAPEEERYLVEIERLLKKRVTIALADGFNAVEVAMRATFRASVGRQDATSKPTRPKREHAAEGRVPRQRSDAQSEESDLSSSYGDRRRAEREAAYAKNPDQPIVRRSHANAAHPHAHMHAAKRGKAIPALLQKRKVRDSDGS